jgi:hypothetical protein
LPDQNGVVTREALHEAVYAGIEMLDFAGGVLSIVTQRAPTVLEGEMVTVGAVVEWRHDARVQPRPEQFEQATPISALAVPGQEGERVVNTRTGEEFVVTAEPSTEAEPGPEPDSFDYSKLEDEDVEEPSGVAS